MLIAGFMPESFVDWRGKMVATIFTHGCNMRCPFCHNYALVTLPPAQKYTEEIVLAKIEELQGWIDGVCITGGEPTIHRDLPDFIKKVREKVPVKLDTNGTNPDILREVIHNVDYVAMDIKAPPELYSKIAGVNVDTAKIEESIKIIKKYAKDYEFRTTFVPTLSPEDIKKITEWLAPAKRYVIQQFSTSGGTLSEEYLVKKPHTPNSLNYACTLTSGTVDECIVANL